MKLPFGVYQGQFIHISEVDSGRTDVLCPYCQQKLVAKKGRIKRHHFAHDGQGCTLHFSEHFFGLSGRLPIKLPLSVYANQKLGKILQFQKELEKQAKVNEQKKDQENTLLPAIKQQLNELNDKDETGNIQEIIDQLDRYLTYKIAPFPDFHLIRLPQFTEGYTDGNRIGKFEDLYQENYEFFYPIAFLPYIELLKNYHQKELDIKEIQAKIELFKKDLAFFDQFNLYFLEITADYKKIYKIGLTSRNITTRMKEIELTLKNYYLEVELKLLFQQKGVAFIETFFKQKYAKEQLKIGQLTEYFSFSDALAALILKDLTLLKFAGKMPNRDQLEWVDWIYFNFNGKIYGQREKSVYIKQQKFILSFEEYKRLLEVTCLPVGR